MKFGRISATPYCNYSLLCILLLDVFCSSLWNLVEYKILFPVAIICCILTIRYYISYDFHEVLLIKLSIVEYNYGYCKMCCWLYQLLLSLKYFCKILLSKLKVIVFSIRIVHLLLTNSCVFLSISYPYCIKYSLR